MMHTQQIAAIVLLKKNYKEYDELVWLFTEEYGIISAILHGSKRKKNKYGGELSLFSYVNIELKKRTGLSTIYNFQIVNRYYHNEKELMNLYLYGSEISELLRRILLENNQYPELLSIVDGLYKYIVVHPKSLLPIAFLQKELLPYTGMHLEFQRCAICRRKQHIMNFSYQAGGLICAECNLENDYEQQYQLSEIKTLVAFSRLTIDNLLTVNLTAHDVHLLSEFWMNIYNDYLGITLKSDTVLKKLDDLNKEE